jgi:hypothetical protein
MSLILMGMDPSLILYWRGRSGLAIERCGKIVFRQFLGNLHVGRMPSVISSNFDSNYESKSTQFQEDVSERYPPDFNIR